jgi:ketosteroid isomerase-like protein
VTASEKRQYCARRCDIVGGLSDQGAKETNVTTPEANKRAVVAAWQAIASRDPKRIAAMFTEDAEWLAPPRNATAVALDGPSHIIGREEIARMFGSKIWKLFIANVRADVRGLYGDGDVVVLEQRMHATLRSGNAYDNDYCFVLQLENGLIRRVREYMDTAKGNRLLFGCD